MHDDQVDLKSEDALALIAAQFPELASLPVERLETTGTENAIFRIGADKVARFPLRHTDPERCAQTLRQEADAMRELAAHCPVSTPAPIAIGSPQGAFPMPWSIQTWVAGQVATPAGLERSDRFAADLADLVVAIRQADTRGRRFSGGGRGGNLSDHDDWLETCFAKSAALFDVRPFRIMWDRFRLLPAAGPDVMSHKDLTPFNLLVSGDRLEGVIDGGSFGPADPALDLVAAWHMLDADRRRLFRATLGVSDVSWRRGAAWALQQAIGLVWYYEETNPRMASLGRTTLARLASDPEL